MKNKLPFCKRCKKTIHEVVVLDPCARGGYTCRDCMTKKERRKIKTLYGEAERAGGE